MKVMLAGLELANPVIAASGTFGYGIEFEEIVSPGADRRIRHQGHFAEPDAGAPRAADDSDRGGHAQRHRPAEHRRRRVHRQKAARTEALSACQRDRQRLRLHGRRLHCGRRAPEPGGRNCRVRTQRLVSERPRGRHGVRRPIAGRSSTWWAGCKAATQAAAVREAVAERHLDCADGEGLQPMPAPTPSAW